MTLDNLKNEFSMPWDRNNIISDKSAWLTTTTRSLFPKTSPSLFSDYTSNLEPIILIFTFF